MSDKTSVYGENISFVWISYVSGVPTWKEVSTSVILYKRPRFLSENGL